MVTKGAPCEFRIADLQRFHEENADELEKEVEDGWVKTMNPVKKNAEDGDKQMDIDEFDNDKM